MLVEILFLIIAIYLLLGFVFGLAFMAKGITKIDEAAKGSSISFRIIIFPGMMVFWPVLLRKWIKDAKINNND
jgi:hypothetical protein